MQNSTQRERLLGVYLDDHRAGAAGGVALVNRMLGSNPDNYLTPTLRELADEIERDRRLLDDVHRRLGFSPNRFKIVMAGAGELVSRLKANGFVRGYSPLSRLEEFEMLSAGISTKASLWSCCELAVAGRREVADIDFGALRDDAERQLAKLEHHRDQIVDDAFGVADSDPDPSRATTVTPGVAEQR